MMVLKEQEKLNNRSLKANLGQYLQKAISTNRLLTLTGLVMVVVLVCTIGGLIFDPRVITGAPAWLKPAKFAISISLYCLTFVWLLSFVKGHPRLVAIAAYVTGIGLLVELVIIVVQVVRGTTSHFNKTTSLDSTLFSIMGSFVMLIWLANLLAAFLLLFQKFPDPVMAWSLRLALFLTAVGAIIAFFMIAPTPTQSAALASGAKSGIIGAHSVGVADGGPGLPILGWSTVGGDLRVPHFFGLHALQLIPLIGWLIARSRNGWLTTHHRVVLVWAAGLGYLGWLGILVWQALRGQSIIVPDSLTLLAIGGLVTVVLIVVASVYIQASSKKNSLKAS